MQASHSHGLRDRGAAAVEFALVFPLLAAVTIGVISLGFALHVQTVLDNAAREAVRVAALSSASDRIAQARQAAIDTAAPTVAVTAGDVTISPSLLCVRGTTVTATVEIDHRLIAGIGTITLQGQGTMRCGG